MWYACGGTTELPNSRDYTGQAHSLTRALKKMAQVGSLTCCLKQMAEVETSHHLVTFLTINVSFQPLYQILCRPP